MIKVFIYLKGTNFIPSAEFLENGSVKNWKAIRSIDTVATYGRYKNNLPPYSLWYAEFIFNKNENLTENLEKIASYLEQNTLILKTDNVDEIKIVCEVNDNILSNYNLNLNLFKNILIDFKLYLQLENIENVSTKVKAINIPKINKPERKRISISENILNKYLKGDTTLKAIKDDIGDKVKKAHTLYALKLNRAKRGVQIDQAKKEEKKRFTLGKPIEIPKRKGTRNDKDKTTKSVPRTSRTRKR